MFLTPTRSPAEQSLCQILEASVNIGSRSLDVQLDSLLGTLHPQVRAGQSAAALGGCWRGKVGFWWAGTLEPGRQLGLRGSELPLDQAEVGACSLLGFSLPWSCPSEARGFSAAPRRCCQPAASAVRRVGGVTGAAGLSEPRAALTAQLRGSLKTNASKISRPFRKVCSSGISEGTALAAERWPRGSPSRAAETGLLLSRPSAAGA